jgi:ribose-phosphate pyrophosphokinase
MHVVYHPHTLSLEQSYGPSQGGKGMRLVGLSGMDMFVAAMDEWSKRDDVIAVATDAGGAKFTHYFAEDMRIPFAVADKTRRSGSKTESIGIIGEFEGKKLAILVDDETSTGGTLLRNVKEMHKRGLESEIAISHLKLNRDSVAMFTEAHQKYGLRRVHVTDTVPQRTDVLALPFLRVHPLARTFALVVNRIHYDQSVSELSNYLQNGK